MNFPVDNAFLLEKRYHYVTMLLLVYQNFFADPSNNTELVAHTAKSTASTLPEDEVSNVTTGIGNRFKIVHMDLTYDSDDDNDPILSVNRDAERMQPQPDVHSKYYDATIPPDVLETLHASQDIARDALIAYCASIGFSAKRYKIKGKYHLYGCDYGDLSRGAIRDTTRNTPGKNRCCPWR